MHDRDDRVQLYMLYTRNVENASVNGTIISNMPGNAYKPLRLVARLFNQYSITS